MYSEKETVANLKSLQFFIANKLRALDSPERSAAEKIVLLVEEVGEVARSIRLQEGLHSRKSAPLNTDHLGDELVDVLNYLLDIANHYEIDMDEAFRRKWNEVDKRFRV